jgi:hypothetical protein
MRRLAALPMAVTAVLAVGTPAFAAWVLPTGTGTGTGNARSLNPATGATASASGNTVTITWTNGSNPAGTAYEVVRNSSSPATLSCTATPCTDSGAPDGTYSYSVWPKLQSWTGAGATTGNVTVAASAVKLALSASPSTLTAGTTTTVTITAQRPDNTTDTAFSGSRTVTWGGTAYVNGPTSGSPSAPATVTFSNGVATAAVTLVKAGSGSITAGVSGLTDGSTNVTVNAAAPKLTWSGASPPCDSGTASSTVGGAGFKSKVARATADDFGNSVPNTSAVTVTLTQVGQGTVSPTSLGMAAGENVTGSPGSGANAGVFAYTFSANGHTGTVTASAPGYQPVSCTATR